MSQINTNAILDASGGTTATVNGFAPTVSNMAGRNRIINGAWQCTQRGDYTSATSLPTSSAYYLDRFRFRRSGVTGTFTHKLNQTLDNNDVVNTVRLDVTSTATGNVHVLQIFEDVNYFKNKTITFSARVKSNSTNARLILNADGGGGTTSSSTHTGGGNWELLTGTATLTSGVTGVQLYAGIQAAGTGDVAGVTSGDFFEISEIQVEAGSVATPFEHRQYGQELALCQRYCQVLTYQGYETLIGVGMCLTSARILTDVPLKAQMRAQPSCSVVGSVSSIQNLMAGVGSWYASSGVSFTPNPDVVRLDISYPSGYFANGYAAETRIQSGASIVITAEL